MKRLTTRKAGTPKVFLPATKGSACMGQYCQNAAECDAVPTRECSYLKAIDRLADLEDIMTLYNINSIEHLTDILIYCKSVGIINRITDTSEDSNEETAD